MERRCETCLWWEDSVPDLLPDEGECRRRAPVPWRESVETQGLGRRALWPLTFALDWCGEWHAQPVEQEPSTDAARARS